LYAVTGVQTCALPICFVTAAIRRAPQLGRGHSPVNHAVPVRFTRAGVFVADEIDEMET